MRLRRLLAVLLAALALAGFTIAPARAEPGPACADIVNGSGGYVTAPNTTQEFVSANAETAAVACDRLAYTLNVYTTTGALLVTDAADVVDGAGFSSLNFFVEVPDGPTEVCVTLTSSVRSHVFDTAPDAPESGCAVGAHLTLGGGSGAGGWH